MSERVGGPSRERAVAAMAERFVVLYLHVERGLLPLSRIEPVMDWRLRQTHPPIRPTPGRRLVTDDDYRHVRVCLPTPTKAYVSAVTRDPQGRWGALVLQLQHRRRPIDDRPMWQVIEVARLERERQPRVPHAPQRTPTQNPAADVPVAGLDTPPASAATTYEFAMAALRVHEAEYEELRRKHAADAANTPSAMAVSRLRAAEQGAERWRRILTGLDQHLADSRQRQAMRDELRYVDTAASLRAPAYLTRLLGPLPQGDRELTRWRRAAGIIEGYRQCWKIVDREEPFGPLLPASREQQAARIHAHLRLRQLGYEITLVGAQRERPAPKRPYESPGLDLD